MQNLSSQELISDESFIDVMIDNEMIEEDTVILRPLEYDKEKWMHVNQKNLKEVFFSF